MKPQFYLIFHPQPHGSEETDPTSRSKVGQDPFAQIMVILGPILWCSMQSCCLQCWFPTRQPIPLPAAPPWIQFPAKCAWERSKEDCPSAWAPAHMQETQKNLLPPGFEKTQHQMLRLFKGMRALPHPPENRRGYSVLKKKNATKQ